MKIKCSRCGKSLKDIVIKVTSSITPMKLINDSQLVPVDNIEESTSEYLCLDCFDKYAECLNVLNQDLNGQYSINMVETVNDIQYGDEQCY